jgi:hypothetical protein
MAIGFVPEGQHDSSQARSAWNHEENGPRPSGTIEPILLTLGLTMTSTLRPSLRDGAALRRYPGTSCLAISQSLRDKSHSVPNLAPFNPGLSAAAPSASGQALRSADTA